MFQLCIRFAILKKNTQTNKYINTFFFKGTRFNCVVFNVHMPTISEYYKIFNSVTNHLYNIFIVHKYGPNEIHLLYKLHNITYFFVLYKLKRDFDFLVNNIKSHHYLKTSGVCLYKQGLETDKPTLHTSMFNQLNLQMLPCKKIQFTQIRTYKHHQT